MKWVPLTNDTLDQLRSSGYSHLVVKTVAAADPYESDRDFVTLEALKDRDTSDVNGFAIASDFTHSLLSSTDADYYVVFD